MRRCVFVVFVLLCTPAAWGQATFPKPPVTISDSATKAPLSLTERSAEPSSPATGHIYLDDGTNAGSTLPLFRRYTGAAWENIGMFYDPNLGAIAGLTTAANKAIYWTAAGTAALYDLTAFGRSILDDANEAAFKATVNLEIGTDVQAYDADLTSWAGVSPHASWQDILDGTTTTAANGRTIKSQLNIPYFNVLDYGADPTGVADSTAAIQAAIDAAELTGGTVYVPAGVYLVSQLEIDSGITILGEGFYSRDTSYYYDFTKGSTFAYSGAGSQSIININPTVIYGVFISRINFVEYETGMEEGAVVYYDQGQENDVNGINIEPASSHGAHHIVVEDCGFFRLYRGVYMNGGASNYNRERVRIERCSFEYNTRGLEIRGSGTTQTDVTHCRFVAERWGEYGIYVYLGNLNLHGKNYFYGRNEGRPDTATWPAYKADIWVRYGYAYIESAYSESTTGNFVVQESQSFTGAPMVLNQCYALTEARSYTVSAFSDAGAGEVQVDCSSAHYFVEGDRITISGTTNYDGTYTIDSADLVDANSFNITDTWVSDDGTGTVKTNRTLTIEAFSDAGAGEVQVDFVGDHRFYEGSIVAIAGTTNYDGIYKLEAADLIDANSISITDTWVADDATGTGCDSWDLLSGVTTTTGGGWITVLGSSFKRNVLAWSTYSKINAYGTYFEEGIYDEANQNGVVTMHGCITDKESTGTGYSENSPLHVKPLATAPSEKTAYDIYFDDGTNTGSGNPGWRYYTGTAWADIGPYSSPTFLNGFTLLRASDTAASAPIVRFQRERDGDPTLNVADGDYIGQLNYEGYHTDGWDSGAYIRATVSGTPGNGDMPTKLELMTTPDGTATPLTRLTIGPTGLATFDYGVSVKNGATSAGYTDLYEDSDNGTNYIRLIGPDSTGTDIITLPTDTEVAKTGFLYNTAGVLTTAVPNAGTDVTADLEEEAHASEHAVSAADTVFPADPGADRFLMWDDDPGVLVFTAIAGGGDMLAATYDVAVDGYVDGKDVAYGAGWNGDVNAPSMNAVYDQIELLGGDMTKAVYDVGDDGNVDGNDAAYGAGWNGDVNAPSKNAVYDQLQLLSGDITAVGPGYATGAAFTDGVVSTGTTAFVWEGTTDNANEYTVTVPEDPASDIVFTWPTVSLDMTNGLDFDGAIDIDYGSADITDHTFVSDGGTSILDGDIKASGNSGNNPKTLLTLTNSDEPATTETSQTSDMVFHLMGTETEAAPFIAKEAAKISAYKVSDWFAADGTDHDSGLKFYTMNDASSGLRLTITNTGAATFASTVEASALTEGGVGVPNVNDDLSVFAATTSAKLAGVLTDETGTGGDVYANSPTFVDDITIHSAGVKITGDGDGAMTILGLGDGFDEDLTLNLDDTENTGTFSSSTGLATLAFTGIALTADLTGNVTGNASGSSGSCTGNAATASTAAAGDSATAFFSAGTIEHEYGGLEADVSAYDGFVKISGGATSAVGANAGTDITADLEEETHASEHAVGGADTVFPADPDADRVLMWDDDPGALVFTAAGTGDMTKAVYDSGDTGGVTAITTVDSIYAGDYVLLVGAAVATSAPKTDGALTYSADSGTLAATYFSGEGSSLTNLNGENIADNTIDDDSIDFGSGADQVDLADIPGGTAGANAFDFGGATSVEIPNGTDPDVDAMGELSIDSDGANEVNDVVLRATDTGGDTQYAMAMAIKAIQTTIVNPQDMDDAERDLCPIWHNNTGMTYHITEIWCWASDDDTSIVFEVVTETDWSAPATIEACEIASNGTSIFYVTKAEADIDDATILAGEILTVDFDDEDDPGFVKISINGYFDANID